MPTFSILARVREASPERLQRMVDSLLEQSIPDWELVLVVGHSATVDRELVADQTSRDSRIRSEVRADDELLAWSVTALLDTLGDWIGFIGQDDALVVTALEQVSLGIQAHPTVQVLYSDEWSQNQHGLHSRQFSKQAFNPQRLRHQEYLRDFVAIRRSLLETTGIDRLASDRPTHDLYLRTLETYGSGAFVNLPQPLYLRHRDHYRPDPDPRQPGYDLHAVKQHLARCRIPAFVRQCNGAIQIEYRFTDSPTVTVVVTLGDNVQEGTELLKALAPTIPYPNQSVRALYAGNDPAALDTYMTLTAGLGYSFLWIQPADRIDTYNQLAKACDTRFIVFVEALPLSPRWLRRLVDHALLPDAGAIGPRITHEAVIRQPGIVGWVFDGAPWNHAGTFNILKAPHQTAAVSPVCLLVDTRHFLEVGGFDPELPTLYGMDLCLRLDQSGLHNLQVPDVHVAAFTPAVTDPAEIQQLRAIWPGWTDRFGLHLPL